MKSREIVDYINEGHTKADIIKKFPKSNYMFFKNIICEMDGFIHPGGKYVI